jgi:glutamate racemase
MVQTVDSPIGIFDSGIGGLTVAAAIHRLMPHESIIYFGDTAHFPYGDKSPELIESYGIVIADYLANRGCKMVVIACNTASAHAYKAISDKLGNQLPIINVIDPAAEFIAGKFPKGKVGVIGTRGTIQSGIYPRRIKKYSRTTEVTSQATPLLAPMIEEGFFNNKISKAVIHSYLEKKTFQGIEAIILGCTHYPLIRKEIEAYYAGQVEVVDSAEIVAQTVQKTLSGRNLISKNEKPQLEFYVSDYTESFERSALFFFPSKVKLEKLDIWSSDK